MSIGKSSGRTLTFEIHFSTQIYLPSNEVYVCCHESLEQGLIRGEYAAGTWHFRIPFSVYSSSATVVFFLNAVEKMRQDPIDIVAGQESLAVTDKDVEFLSPPNRYVHAIESLVNEETDFSRRYVPRNLDPSPFYDVIIVGSGMGGGILADQASDLGLSVLLLEAGTIHLPGHVGNSPTPPFPRTCVAYDNRAGSKLGKDVCINLGGRSVYWSSVIPRMNSWDLEHWPTEVVQYLQLSGYTRAERLFRKRTEYNDYEKALRARLEERLPTYRVAHLPRSYHQEGSWITARIGNPDERPTGYFSTAALLLNSLSFPGKGGSDNLTLNLNHLVTSLKHSGRTVTAVVCQDLIQNRERIYKARFVVLAAGATESPCIALRSCLDDKSKKIGRGLTDHQSAEVRFEIPKRSIQITPRDQAKLFLLPRDDLGNSEKFSCELALNWRYWEPRYEDDDLYAAQLPEDAAIRSTIKFLFRNELNDENFVQLGVRRPIVSVAPMMRRPFERAANRLKDDIFDFLDVKESKATSRLIYREASETYHTGGSLRMGEHGQAVVDTNLRFHEYDNLFCCDLSVFPDIPTANPALTLGALALRLAESLAQAKSCGAGNGTFLPASRISMNDEPDALSSGTGVPLSPDRC